MNNRGYISKETRKKVYDAMKKLNYQPNEIARSLFRQHTNVIGVIVPSVNHPFFSKLVEKIEFYASRRGYKILLCDSYHERQKEIEYIEMLKSSKVDGIIMGSRTTDILNIFNFDFPLVTVDRIMSDKIPCVSSDNYQGGSLATKALIARGCKKLAHITGSLKLNLMANQRYAAFMDICDKEKIDHVVVTAEENQFSSMDYKDLIENLFREHPDVDGVVASSDVIAAEVIQIAISKGRVVPGDLKVIGYDDTSIASLTTPQISTIRQPIEEIGRYAVDLILDQQKGEIVPMRTILPVTLIERQST